MNNSRVINKRVFQAGPLRAFEVPSDTIDPVEEAYLYSARTFRCDVCGYEIVGVSMGYDYACRQDGCSNGTVRVDYDS